MNKCSHTIGWADFTWNPVTGCYGPGGTVEKPAICGYCYAERIAKRFSGSKAFPNGFEPTFHRERLKEPIELEKPSRIFVGSMTDMFGEWVPAFWLARVLESIAHAQQHKYYMLTKQPGNVLRLIDGALEMLTSSEHVKSVLPERLRDIIWIGASVDTELRALHTLQPMAKVSRVGWKTFISIEPMLTRIDPIDITWADWVIIGGQTGIGSKRHQPEIKWVEEIIEHCVQYDKPVFVKNSLKDISDLQQWPS